MTFLLIRGNLSGILNPINCSITCNVGSDPDVARLIILLELKRFAGEAFIHNQHLVSMFFNLKKLMTLHGSMGI